MPSVAIGSAQLNVYDAIGSPGTDLTFFDWLEMGLSHPGLGSVSLPSFRVRGESLDFWKQRLLAAGIPSEWGEDPAGRRRLKFCDPEGQSLALVDDTGLAGESVPWDKMVLAGMAIRGILGVNLERARPDGTRRTHRLIGIHDD